MSKKNEEIKPVTGTPAAFGPEGAKINELVVYVNALKHLAGLGFFSPLVYSAADMGPALGIDIAVLKEMLGAPGAFGGGGGIPAGYQERAFAVCNNGTPVTYTFLVR